MIQTDKVLDAKGLACPMPIVKTRKIIKDMEGGQVLEIHSTDPGTVADLKAWSESAGHEYVGNEEENGVWRHFVKKSGGAQPQQATVSTVDNSQLLASLKADNRAILIDVREATDYDARHIAGALSIPLGELDEKIATLNKEQSYYMICHAGNRSSMASQKLLNAGCTSVMNVMPGMSGWSGETESTAGGMQS